MCTATGGPACVACAEHRGGEAAGKRQPRAAASESSTVVTPYLKQLIKQQASVASFGTSFGITKKCRRTTPARPRPSTPTHAATHWHHGHAPHTCRPPRQEYIHNDVCRVLPSYQPTNHIPPDPWYQPCMERVIRSPTPCAKRRGGPRPCTRRSQSRRQTLAAPGRAPRPPASVPFTSPVPQSQPTRATATAPAPIGPASVNRRPPPHPSRAAARPPLVPT